MKWFPIIIGFLFISMAFCQNLIKNPSFEDYTECPNALGTFDNHVKNWSIPTQGTTDYFNTCSTVMGAPENFNGVQYPKFGVAYAGLYFYAPADYREYIQVALKRKLQKDKTYHLSFYISLAEGSDFAVKDFDVVMSFKPVKVSTRKHLSLGKLYQQKDNRFQLLKISHSYFNEDKSVWIKVQTTFKAKGFERYLILGNLKSNEATRKVQTKRKESKKGAYYYIDMVSLTANRQDQNFEKIIAQEIDMTTDTLYTFKNIHFDFDQFNISSQAENELKIIKVFLLNQPDLKIEIHGHTDAIGNETYNYKLSERRAQAIATYFKNVGIGADRIVCFGHGSSKPLINNESEENRRKNRRVAFRFRSTIK